MKSFLMVKIAAVFLFFVACSALANDDPYTAYNLLAISAADDRAVLKTPTGAMLTVKAGEAIEELNADVVQILEDRLVLKETHGIGDTVWLFKSNGGESRYQRISAKAPDEMLRQPMVVTSSDLPEKE